ncbi:MAG: nucleotide exchange factor GrpE [Candidatus Micrarchaeota archaeon]
MSEKKIAAPEKRPEVKTGPDESPAAIKAPAKEPDYHKLCLEANKDSEELLTRLKYMQADFENFKKRSSRERIEMAEMANEALLTDLLPILDGLDAAKSRMKEGEERKGIEMILQKLLAVLMEYGLQEIPAKANSDFDPKLQEAVGKDATGDAKLDGKVSATVQRGYLVKGKVLRYSKVNTYMLGTKGE